MRTTMPDEGLAMRVPDGKDSEEIGACDVVPTSTDLHASQERITTQLLDNLEEELNREYTDATGFCITRLLSSP